jgi:hypothetical protein
MSYIQKYFRGTIATQVLRQVGNVETINSQSIRVLERDSNGDITECSGTVSYPTNGGTGYAVGCEYIDTDAVAGAQLYVNEGTNTSCDFNSVKSVTSLFSADNLVSTNKKIQFRDSGLYIHSSADGQLDIVADGRIQLTGKLSLGLNGGALSASGLLMGVGTSADPATTAVAGSIFAEFRTQSTATSGDSRGLYWRHDINGAGGGGDCVRAFSKVTGGATTVRGAHISLDLDTAGSVSGFGAGVDAQVLFGAAAYNDDVTAVNLELYGSAGATVTGRTSMLRPVIQGDSTAVADINANAFFMDLSNVVASAVGFIDTDVTALTGYGSLRVRCPDGVTRYIPITTGA